MFGDIAGINSLYKLFFDLFFAANLTVFSESQQVTTTTKFASYVGFFWYARRNSARTQTAKCAINTFSACYGSRGCSSACMMSVSSRIASSVCGIIHVAAALLS